MRYYYRAQVKLLGIQKPPDKITNKKHPLFGMKFPDKYPAEDDEVDQSEAKQYLPPKCTIWKAGKRGAWAFHPEGHARMSEPWSRHGGSSRRAMLACVQRAWLLFNEDHELPERYCPIKGVLE